MRVPSRYSHEITNIFSFPNSLAMFVPVLLAACWYYPSTLVCLLLDLYTTHCTVHTAKCKVHTALRDAWCQNSKFCNKGRHSMNWRDRRESVNNAKSSSSLTGFVSNPPLHYRLHFTFLLLRLYCWSAGWRQCFWAHKTQPIHQTHQTHKLCQTDKSLVIRPTRVPLKLREKSAI